MQKHLSKWHGRFGVFAALIAIYLSVTGLMLNHSHDLGLDKTRVDSSWMLELYGTRPPTGVSARTLQYSVYKLGESLFVGNRLLDQYSSPLTGVAELDQLLIIALKDSILLLNTDGEIIETLTRSSGLPGTIERIGQSSTGLFIQSGQQQYMSDADFLNWLAVSDSGPDISWSKLEAIPSDTEAKLIPSLPAYGPTWERVLQDLHSGRLFKLPGTLLIDLTGVILLLLSISGIISFTLRKKANSKKQAGS